MEMAGAIFQAILLLTLKWVLCSIIPDNKLAHNDALEEDELVQQLMNTPYERDVSTTPQSTIEKIDNINERYRNQELYQGDIKMHPKDPEFTTSSADNMFKRNAVRDRRRLWINKVVPYEISEGLVDFSEDIKAALDDISKVSCISFVKHTDEKNWIEFVSKDGCWSAVGRIFFETGGQELSLGPGCRTTDTIIHEVMHSLGFMHEQSRPDRDQYVKIYWENIKEGHEDNFKKHQGDEIDIQNIQYDYDSIMHYGRRIFAKNRRFPTIVAVGDENRALGSNRLSKRDIVEINLLYDCVESNSSFLSSWSGFGPCDDSCIKSRQRFCDSQALDECPTVDKYGVETQDVTCTTEECKKAIDGHWGRWTSWSACNVHCGWGTRKRQRACDDPQPKNNGTYCSGSDHQTETCKARPCALGKFDCQFEFSFCHWSEESGPSGIYEWRRHKGDTSSHHTGPENDHTYGDETGHYLYAESSSPAEHGDIAVLESREFQPTGESCLSFWYHMFGENMGSLEVFLRDEKTGSNSVMWTRFGDQGTEWKEANVTIRSNNIHRIVFEATRGDGYKGDIAIDDVLFWNSSCKEKMTTAAPTRMTTKMEIKTTLPFKTSKRPTTMEIETTLPIKTTKRPTTMEIKTTLPIKTTKRPTTMEIKTTLPIKTTKRPTTMEIKTTLPIKTTKRPTTMEIKTTLPIKTTRRPTTMEVKTTLPIKTTKRPTTMEIKTTQPIKTTRRPTTMEIKTTLPIKTTRRPTTMEIKTTQPIKTTRRPTTMEVKTTLPIKTTKRPTTMEIKTTLPIKTTKNPTTMEVKTTQPIKTTRRPTTMEIKTTKKMETTKGATTKPTMQPVTGVKLLGCYRDWGRINGKRPFPYFIDMRYSIKWRNMTESFVKIIQKCRAAVKKRQEFHQVFAIQFFGECWLGEKEDTQFDRDGRLPMKACFKGLVGRSFSMMVYSII